MDPNGRIRQSEEYFIENVKREEIGGGGGEERY